MKKKIPSSTRVTQFFAYTQMHDLEIIQLGDLQDDFQISPRQEKELLSYLAKKGSIIRLKRGIYVAPKTIPPGGKWQPDPKYLISCLMDVTGANYYIGGQYAFHYHGLTEQVPNSITVYNDKISGKKKIGRLDAQFIKIAPERLGNPITIRAARERKFYIATIARCIVDGVVDYSRYNTLPKAYNWIVDRLQQPDFLSELIKTTMNYGNISAKRRIGFIVFSRTNNDKLVKPLLNTLKTSKGWIPLDPYSEPKGPTCRQWGIINNVR